MKESEIIVGTPVILWKVVNKDGTKSDPIETEITKGVWHVGRQRGSISKVCAVRGFIGGVQIHKLEKMNSIITMHYDL